MKIGKLSNEDFDFLPLPLYQYKSELDAGYDDITSAESLDEYGHLFLDYIFVRYEIQCILFPKANPQYPTVNFSGWGSLTASEKEIMARYILAPYQLRLTQFSDESDERNWFNLLDRTQGTGSQSYTGRALIIENMRKCVANKVRKEELSMSSTQSFFKDVFEKVQWYIAAATPDFKCWLMNEEGSDYETNGFAQKSYYSASLRDELNAIYNGQ